MSRVLELKAFAAQWRGRGLHKPVSLSVQCGQLVRLSGGNGSGKSTLLRSIVGVHREATGRLWVDRRSLTYKPQKAAFFSSMTVSEAVRLVRGFEKASYQRLLDVLSVTDFANVPLGVLSGGEAQRAMLLLALLRTHSIALLDEPLAGVDDFSKQKIVDCVNEWESAILLVEHRPSLSLNVDSQLVLQRATEDSE